MAFQLIDDVLDLIGDPEKLGKPVGNDLRSGVLTLPVLLELRGARSSEVRALLSVKDQAALDQVANIVSDVGRINETIDLAHTDAEAASVASRGLSGSGAAALIGFASNYLDWSLEEFAA